MASRSASRARAVRHRAATLVRLHVGTALWRLSALGDRLGIAWLTYNPIVLLYYHRCALADAPGVMATIRETLPDVRTYADIGSGTGALAAAARAAGLDAVACERSFLARLVARRQGVRCTPFDLESEPPARLGRTSDLASCVEVAEHVPEPLATRLVTFVAAQAPLVIFTAAPPGQGGAGHVNEQPKDYWIAEFERAGMRHDPALAQRLVAGFASHGVRSPWFHRNLMAFRRAGPS